VNARTYSANITEHALFQAKYLIGLYN